MRIPQKTTSGCAARARGAAGRRRRSRAARRPPPAAWRGTPRARAGRSSPARAGRRRGPPGRSSPRPTPPQRGRAPRGANSRPSTPRPSTCTSSNPTARAVAQRPRSRRACRACGCAAAAGTEDDGREPAEPVVARVVGGSSCGTRSPPGRRRRCAVRTADQPSGPSVATYTASGRSRAPAGPQLSGHRQADPHLLVAGQRRRPGTSELVSVARARRRARDRRAAGADDRDGVSARAEARDEPCQGQRDAVDLGRIRLGHETELPRSVFMRHLRGARAPVRSETCRPSRSSGPHEDSTTARLPFVAAPLGRSRSGLASDHADPREVRGELAAPRGAGRAVDESEPPQRFEDLGRRVRAEAIHARQHGRRRPRPDADVQEHPARARSRRASRPIAASSGACSSAAPTTHRVEAPARRARAPVRCRRASRRPASQIAEGDRQPLTRRRRGGRARAAEHREHLAVDVEGDHLGLGKPREEPERQDAGAGARVEDTRRGGEPPVDAGRGTARPRA